MAKKKKKPSVPPAPSPRQGPRPQARGKARVPNVPGASSSRTWWIIGAVVLVLVIVAAAVAVIQVTGGDNASVATTGGTELPGAAEVQSLLQGIPQDGIVLGDPAAPVTVVEYADLQCPFCKEFNNRALHDLIEQYVRPGQAKVEFRGLNFIGPDSARGLAAALAAGEQDKLWNFTEILYLNQGRENEGWLDDAFIAAAAESIPGLDLMKLQDALDSDAVHKQMALFQEQATLDNVHATPTVLVGQSGGRLQPVKLESLDDPTPVARAIDALLAS